jgi:NTP pyrophosphatase (non-canonical NTP hydrolase)
VDKELIQKVIAWGDARGLLSGDPTRQLLKLTEELGELVAAWLRDDDASVEDAIGDMLVVMIMVGANLRDKGENPENFLEYCLEGAWHIIENRTGVTTNGIFIKDTSR